MHNILSAYLQTLLHKHSCVILPGFGGFVANYKSATIDTHTDFFTPPSLNIAFNQALTHNDGLLMQEIAKEENVSLDDAEKQLYKNIDLFRRELYLKGRVEFDGIGLLYLDSDYKIQFKVALKANLLPQSYGLRSFRFASARHRKLTQSFEKEYMNGTAGNRRIIISSVAAASVIVFISLALFINSKINRDYAAEASILPIKDSVELKVEKEETPKVEENNKEISTQKSLALHYSEPYNTVKYHIISGSFTNKKSAETFAQKMKAEGYSPTFVNEGDKIRVSIFTYEDRYEALKQLDFMRVTKDKNVWLLKESN